MLQTRSNKSIDWLIITIVLIIMGFGVANIYSVDPDYGMKQIVRIGLGFGMIFGFLIITSISKNFFDIYAGVFYIIGVLALVGVLFVGKEINGAKAWYSIGGVGIQPVELMKIATGLMIGHVLNTPGNDIKTPKTFLFCMGLLAIPAILILLQPDVGSLFVFGAFLLALYREGMSPFWLLVPITLGGVFLLGIIWDSHFLVLIIGFLLLIFLIIFLLNISRPQLSMREMHLLLGALVGISIFFLMNFIFTDKFYNEKGFLNLFNNRLDFIVNLSSAVLSLIALLSALGMYLSYHNYHYSIRKILNVQASHFRQFITGFLIIFTSLGIISFIAYKALDILDKLPTHQRERILVLFEGEAKYRDTSGYNLLYSKTAIGSGELWGTGWNKGTITDGRFVPEQWTDYIFCTVGEEWGFIGSSLLVILYGILIARIFFLAEKQKKIFSRYFGYSIGSILMLHFFVNIGMVMGLFPTVGIPLPFLSYGGSSLWGFMLMLFIFLKLNYENSESLI